MSSLRKKERILGVDPGFGRTGFGIIEGDRNEWKLVCYGCIETTAIDSFIDRIEQLHTQLTQIIKKFRPTQAAVEDLFFYKNVTTAMKVGQARGVILLTLRQANIPVFECTPLQVKQSLTGYGRAEKGQIQKMVQMILKIKKKISPDDAADALAIALTAGATLRVHKKVSS
ncbi:MAG: crossover junction endodeoxyribonuclease RuvC [Candidatus Magasanikbacteria bacterium]|jgi:crossover junction endodeoxyribonuclease RuvC